MSEPVELLHCAACSRLSFYVQNASLLECTNCWTRHRIVVTADGRLEIRPEGATTCRRCVECQGEEHHWLTLPECPEEGEPYFPCKHCNARAGVCDLCCEVPVWPIMSNQPLCEDCREENEWS